MEKIELLIRYFFELKMSVYINKVAQNRKLPFDVFSNLILMLNELYYWSSNNPINENTYNFLKFIIKYKNLDDVSANYLQIENIEEIQISLELFGKIELLEIDSKAMSSFSI